jgi:hypothetical protein
VDFKALEWPALADKKKKVAEGDNTKFFFEVEGESADRLKSELAKLETANSEIGSGTKQALIGWHQFASSFTAIKALFAYAEPDGDRSTRGYGEWITKQLADKPDIQAKMTSKNAPSKLSLMAAFPLEMCERLDATTPSMLEKNVLEVRRDFTALLRDSIVEQEGDEYTGTVETCAAALVAYIPALKADSATKLEAENERLAKKAKLGALSPADFKNVTSLSRDITQCDIMGIVVSSADRLKNDAEKIHTACGLKAKIVEQRAKDKEEAERAAESAVVDAFKGLDAEGIANRLFDMIEGRLDAVTICKIMLEYAEESERVSRESKSEGDTATA